MYTLAVNGNFVANHYLTSGDWGKESRPHAHSYKIEVLLKGPELNGQGYLVDIVDLEYKLNRLSEYFENQNLNDLPEFKGLNPSIENLARLNCQKLCQHLDLIGLTSISVTIWEDDKAWGRFEHNIRCGSGL